MACAELLKMRAYAHKLYLLLREKSEKARVHVSESKDSNRNAYSDFEPFLKNKLLTLSEKIGQHLNQHQCE
jgi:hypothetical protein